MNAEFRDFMDYVDFWVVRHIVWLVNVCDLHSKGPGSNFSRNTEFCDGGFRALSQN